MRVAGKMYTGDMQQKRHRARLRVDAAIKSHGGTTFVFTGIAGDDVRVARTAVEAGIRIIEPNHGDHAMGIGFRGVRTMDETVAVRDLMPMEEMVKVVEGLRQVVGPDVLIFVGAPGCFTSPLPVVLSDDHVRALAQAGADGLHTHKSTISDVSEIVELGHRNGLLVDGYIDRPDNHYRFGVPASTVREVRSIAKQMEQVGVDMIGIMTGMSYRGTAAGAISADTQARLKTLVGAVAVPTIAEGGVNLGNFRTFSKLGVDLVIIGTAINDVVQAATRQMVETLVPR